MKTFTKEEINTELEKFARTCDKSNCANCQRESLDEEIITLSDGNCLIIGCKSQLHPMRILNRSENI